MLRANLIAAWALGPFALGLSLLVWLVGFVYNWKLKATGLWGNLMVSASVASTFLLCKGTKSCHFLHHPCRATRSVPQ